MAAAVLWGLGACSGGDQAGDGGREVAGDVTGDGGAGDEGKDAGLADAPGNEARDATGDRDVERTEVPEVGGGDGPGDGSDAADAPDDVAAEVGGDDASGDGDAGDVDSYVGPIFTEVSAAAGITHVQAAPDACYSKGVCSGRAWATGGAAAGDWDGDGWVDLLVSRIDAPPILYRNQGDGTFLDVTPPGMAAISTLSNGVAWVDIDNDGDLDVYMTPLYGSQFFLLVNDGAGDFTEEALPRGAAVPGPNPHLGEGISVGDYDRDGFVDLLAGEWRRDSIAPWNVALLHNLGAAAPGHFEDVTAAAGLNFVSPDGNDVYVYGPLFTDLDDDGWPDLAVAGDFGTSKLYWNAHDGTFIDGTAAAGVGTDDHGMGASVGDFDGDGRMDWFVTAIGRWCGACTGDTGNRLFRNLGDRTFADVTDAAGVRWGGWGWGTASFDYDNDGDLDIVMTNGSQSGWGASDPMRLWRNQAGVMTEVSGPAGLLDTGAGRGLLVFDYDRDGDQDVFIARMGSKALLYRNDGGNDTGWLAVRVLTSAGSPALGAQVFVRVAADAAPMRREIGSTSAFLGQSEPVAHFGLGEGEGAVAEVSVRWPRDGSVETKIDVARNGEIVFTEPPAGP